MRLKFFMINVKNNYVNPTFGYIFMHLYLSSWPADNTFGILIRAFFVSCYMENVRRVAAGSQRGLSQRGLNPKGPEPKEPE